MKCNKCGFVSFDYLSECKKCGIDLTVVRDGLGLLPVRPAVPFLLGTLLKEYDEFLGEKNEHVDIEDAKPLGAFSEPENGEIEFDADMDFTEVAPEEAQPVASEPVANAPVADVSPEATPEMVLAHDEEPELTIDLQEEAPLALEEVPDGIKEVSKESGEDSLTIEMDLGRELEIALELEPADSVERFQELPESEESIDLRLELDEEPESDLEAAKVAERLQKLSDEEKFNDFSRETPDSRVEGMEIGDEDLLELILDDDELVFDLDGGDQIDFLSGEEARNDKGMPKKELPSIEDINDFVLGVMGEKKRKK